MIKEALNSYARLFNRLRSRLHYQYGLADQWARTDRSDIARRTSLSILRPMHHERYERLNKYYTELDERRWRE